MTDLAAALALERRLLGDMYPISCGCAVKIQCTLPGDAAFVLITSRGAQVCGEHSGFLDYPWDGRLLKYLAPQTWKNWFRRSGPIIGLEEVWREEFEKEFDLAWDTGGRTSMGTVGPPLKYVYSVGRDCAIYRDGDMKRFHNA